MQIAATHRTAVRQTSQFCCKRKRKSSLLRLRMSVLTALCLSNVRVPLGPAGVSMTQAETYAPILYSANVGLSIAMVSVAVSLLY
mmetsp:Transcript_48297/g.88385  ORF Transcript_48297/g.88385 Transcript_48297/m.88385 type:complete len:85 (+) Transcript_48297:170-424(+)